MTITPRLFEAFLKCPTKCWLRSADENPSGNAYAEWVQTQNESFRADAIKRLTAIVPAEECIVAIAEENLKTAKWCLALDVVAQASSPASSGSVPLPDDIRGETPRKLADGTSALQSRLHAVERIPSEGRGKPAQFIHTRFIFTNKITKDDKLLLAFDAFVLSQMLGREVRLGKIIHGDDHATLKVKTSALAGEVRKRLEKIAALLSNPTPPDLVLNRHCAECEFQARCRKIAIEKDDLSLLAGMSAKERQKLRGKGIFTVTQLSYTFRPRRRPKRLRDKREKYHHSLKALAIREKKIYIVGSVELKIEGTPVYLDVEGLPDRDFYYLIGVRIGNGESAAQHSLWADTVEDEGKIWREFLGILETVEKPVLIHYGSYETTFLGRMDERYGGPVADSGSATAIKLAINLLTGIFAHVYFPQYSNGFKEIAGYLGFVWSDPSASGLKAIIWRHLWAITRLADLKGQLLNYNAEDCQALEPFTSALVRLGSPMAQRDDIPIPEYGVIHTELLPRPTLWGKFSSSILEFEEINKAARWDYQREKVYVRPKKRIRKTSPQSRSSSRTSLKINKVVICRSHPVCPNCGGYARLDFHVRTKVVHDLFLGRSSVKKWVVEYRFRYHWCASCQLRFWMPKALWRGTKYGRNLIAYIIYQIVELHIPQRTVWRSLARLFGYDLDRSQMNRFKTRAAEFYERTRQSILDRIVRGNLVHVDETSANIRGKSGYVWVFTNMSEVVYLHSDSREGEIAKATLSTFKGVLVSDFYSLYDSFECPQQKCLLHLMRDLNADILANPYDGELKQIVSDFAGLLKPMIETIDRHGLKTHFLKRHIKFVDGFYKELGRINPESEAALKCKERFERNRGRLFTFLERDGVPWNNNNAEHAVKAFAALRDIMQGSSTQKGLDEYLVLLSVSQTCKYMGVDFLDFLRSGEKDIHAFAESRRRRKRPSQSSQPTDLQTDAIPDGPVSLDPRAGE